MLVLQKGWHQKQHTTHENLLAGVPGFALLYGVAGIVYQVDCGSSHCHFFTLDLRASPTRSDTDATINSKNMTDINK